MNGDDDDAGFDSCEDDESRLPIFLDKPRLRYQQVQTRRPELLHKFAKKTGAWFETACELTFDTFLFEKRGVRIKTHRASELIGVTRTRKLKLAARGLGLDNKRTVLLHTVKQIEIETRPGEAVGFKIILKADRVDLRFRCPSIESAKLWEERFERLRISTVDCATGKRSQTPFDLPSVPTLHPTERRQHIVKEIVDGELTYYKNLDKIDRLLVEYRKTVRGASECCDSPTVTGMDPDILEKFLGANEGLMDLSRMLIQCFHSLGPSQLPLKIGDVFKTFAPTFRVFSSYTNMSSEVQGLFMKQEKLDAEEASALGWFAGTPPPSLTSIRDAVAPLTTCNSLFMQPVQKVMRYVLLLQDLLKRTPKNCTSTLLAQDREKIVVALKTVKNVATQINKEKGDMEMKNAYFFDFYMRFATRSQGSFPKLFGSEPDMKQRLRHTGFLRKFKDGVLTERECFILDTHFVYSKKGYDYISKAIPLSAVTFSDVPASQRAAQSDVHIGDGHLFRALSKPSQEVLPKYAFRVTSTAIASHDSDIDWIFASNETGNLASKCDVAEWMEKLKASKTLLAATLASRGRQMFVGGMAFR